MTKSFAYRRAGGSGFSSSARSVIAGLLGVLLLFSAGTAYGALNAESTSYYEDAQQYLKKGDIRAAVIQLKNAIRADGNNVEARFALAQIYIARSEGAAAEKELRAALSRGMPRDRVLLPLARSLILKNDPEAVLREIEPEDKSDRSAAQLYRLRAVAHIMRQAIDQAEQEIKKALAIEPKSAPILVTQSQILQARGQMAEAEKAVEEALGLSPDFVEALVQKGEVRRAQNDHKQAVAHFDRALEKRADHNRALLGRAASSMALGAQEQARKDVDTVLKRFPQNPFAGYLDAVLLSNAGKHKEAIERIRTARGLDRYAPALYLSGSLNYKVGNLERARLSAEKFNRAEPDSIPGKTLLAAILLRQSEPKKAIELLQPVVTTESADFNGITLLATAYLMEKQPAKAAELYSRAIELNPESSALRMQLARTQLGAGETAQAITELERVIADTPDATAANSLLVLTLVRDGRLDDAEKAARALREKAADKPVSHFLLASIALRRNDTAAGRAALEEALRVDADFLPAALTLALLDRQTGRSDEARQRYEKVLSRKPQNLQAMLGLAQLSVDKRDIDDALTWLNKAAAANPKAVRPLAVKVDLLLAQGRAPAALAAARAMETRAPNNPSTLDALARSQLAEGNQASAIRTYRRLVSVTPDSSVAHYRLGQVLREAGKLDEAAEAFDAATAISPRMQTAWRGRADIVRRKEGIDAARKLAVGLADRIGALDATRLEADLLFDEKQFVEATQLYRKVFDGQASTRTVLRLAGALSSAGEHAEAVSVLENWTSKNQSDNASRFALLSAYIAADRRELALAEGARILAKVPDHAPTLNNVAWLYDQKGDSDKALDYARRAYKNSSGRPEIADTLGWLLAKQGDTDAAIPLLEKAWKGAQTNPEIGYHYASVLARKGKIKEAVPILQKSLESKTPFAERADAEKLAEQLR